MRVTGIDPRLVLIVALVMVGVESPAEARHKTDVLVMKNGDRITCEVKSLSQGELQIKTEYTSGTVTVNWEHVKEIESSQMFRVEASSGVVLTGTIRQEPAETVEDAVMQITQDLAASELIHQDVVRIDQLGANLWKQLDGSIDVGLSYTSDNKTGQLSANATLSRRRELNQIDLAWSTLLNRSDQGSNTTRYNGQAMYRRLIEGSGWFYGGTVDILRSNQQNLKLRLTPAAIAGRTLVHTNRSEAFFWAGVDLNREWFLEPVDNVTDQTSTEAIIGSSLSLFHFDSTQMDTSLVFYPSISQAGRYRLDFNNTLYLDLWGDFYVSFTFYDNFDSQPQGDTPKNDMGVTTSFGWSF